MESIGDRLRNLRERRGWSQLYVAQRTGISNFNISNYERGTRTPDTETVSVLSQLYEVTIDYLVNGDKRPIDNLSKKFDNSTYKKIIEDLQGIGDEVIPTGVIQVPIVADISCGEPIFTEDTILGFIPMGTAILPPGDVNDYVFLRAKGDSMIDADIKDGSFVLIKKQNTADNGDIVAVCVNNETATVKRIHFNGEYVVLSAENRNYMPMSYHARDIRIVGKAIMVTKSL